MRYTPFGRSLSPLIWLAAVTLMTASTNALAAQTATEPARRVLLVNLAPVNTNTDLSEAALREAQMTLDTLRESRHLRLIARQDIDRQLYGAGFPNSLSLTSDMRLLQKLMAADAILGVSVEARPTGYRLLTTLIPASPDGAPPVILAPIDGDNLSSVAQSFARMVARDSTIRRARR